MCSQNFGSQFLVTLNSPLPKQRNDGFPLEFLLKGPENKTGNTQSKLRTNCPKIANKQNYEQMGVSEFQSISVSFSQFQPIAVNFNHFQLDIFEKPL